MLETLETDYVGRTFELEPVCAPGLRLEVINGTTLYGYNVLLGDKKDVAYQRWRFELAAIVIEGSTSYAYYYLVATHWKHVLASHWSSAKDGSNVVQQKLAAEKQNMWRLSDNGDGTFCLINRASKTTQLSVAGNGSTAGTNVQVNTINNESPGQRWKLFPVE